MCTFMHIVQEPDLCMNYNQHHMMRNIQDWHHMQYRVDLSHQNREKGQCAYVHNLCTLFMHAYLIVHDLKPLSDAEKHLGLPSYAISSRSEPPNSTKVPKTSFFALFCTIYALYAYLINYAWPKTTATCWESFRTTTICNIVLIRATKVEKKANVHMCTIYAHCLCMPI